MSNLDKYREAKNFFTGETSRINRTLAFGGIAVIWIFRRNYTPDSTITDIIPDQLQLPLILFVIALGLDLIHYGIASIIWTVFYRWHEYKIQNGWEKDEDVTSSRWNYRIIDSIFWTKIVINMIGFIALLRILIFIF